jgi:hypothetical protein
VADFLQRHWRLVLARAYNQAGEGGEPWRQALATLDDLLWSIEPKAAPEDRARLLGILPALLKRLRTALEALDIGDAWDPFFAQLIRLHVAALHNEAPEPPPIPPEPPRAEGPPSAVLGGSRDFRTLAQVDAEAAQASRPAASAPVVAPPADEPGDPYRRLAQSLTVGAWVELESDRGTRKTLRLSWVSELRGVYLFTNRQGENALTLAATSLADQPAQGHRPHPQPGAADRSGRGTPAGELATTIIPNLQATHRSVGRSAGRIKPPAPDTRGRISSLRRPKSQGTDPLYWGRLTRLHVVEPTTSKYPCRAQRFQPGRFVSTWTAQ